MSEEALRVLVVDDTVVYRRILSEVVEALPDATLTAAASNGKLALARMESNPVDLVLLDVQMPVMDGLETLDAIREKHPDVGVIMVSGVNKNAADITMKALEKGALDFVPKPEGASPQESMTQLIEQLRPLLKVFITKRNLRLAREGRGRPAPPPTRAPAAPAPPPARLAPRPTRFDVVAIGVSTGGPNALAEVIPALPANLGVPVLIVQHMPPLFTKSLADGLDRKSPLPVCEAGAGEIITPNKVFIAPGGHHMVVRGGKGAEGGFEIGLNDNPPENSCRPAADVLFRSVSANFGGNILAVVMTGMGADGCEGVRVMKRRGCYCLTQTEDTCVVYGMPYAVDTAGLSDERVALGQLANRIAALIRNPVTG